MGEHVQSATAAQKRAEFLRAELERHNRLYYVEARPEISDREFDRLLRELQDLEAAHPDIEVFVAAIDERLDENAYIRPGLGDATDAQDSRRNHDRESGFHHFHRTSEYSFQVG